MVALAYLLCTTPVHADEFYFVVIFGAESVPKQPRYTHSWGTFIKLSGCGRDLNSYHMEVFTVSWIAATLEVRPLALLPEKGVNLDLHTSVRHALVHQEQVAQWGPYQTTPEVFRKALAQKARLESGKVLYKARDCTLGPRTQRVSNCIHALTDMEEGPFSRLGHPSILRNGQSASEHIVKQFSCRGWILYPGNPHDWLNARLGLTQYPICHRPMP